MQLNKFSDYGLRVLMYIAPHRDLPYTIPELATQLQVSKNHLVKIVHFMSKQNWIMTMRGKGGGIRLNTSTLSLRLGDILKVLEGDQDIVECNHPPCVLRSRCGLKGVLNQAVHDFYHHLNQYTLQQVTELPPYFKGSTSLSTIDLITIDQP